MGSRVGRATVLLSSKDRVCHQFDLSKNYPLTPKDLKASSDQFVWWRCSEGHSWSARIRDRAYTNSTCPKCRALKVDSGSSLRTLSPSLSLEFDGDRNYPLTPESLHAQSNRKVFWVCSKGDHSWEASPASRFRMGSGCPYCSGRLPIRNLTDLATVYPQLANEFDLDKNKPYLPQDFTSKSSRKVWWRCRRDHSWQSTIASRTRPSYGCALCFSTDKESIPERTLKGLLDGEKARIVVSGLSSKSCEVDIALRFPWVVEYDGWFWHKDREVFDVAKTKALIEQGYKVIRVREVGKAPLKYLPKIPGLYQVSFDPDRGDYGKLAVVIEELIQQEKQ